MADKTYPRDSRLDSTDMTIIETPFYFRAAGNIIDKGLSAPPGGEAEGDRYIVAAGASGAWTGKEQQIAEYHTKVGAAAIGWYFIDPHDGMIAKVVDEDLLYYYNHATTSWKKLPQAIDLDDLKNVNTAGKNDNDTLSWDAGTSKWIPVANATTDEKVKIDAAATAGYLGAASNDGVLRAGSNLSYADGGDFVTLNLAAQVVIATDITIPNTGLHLLDTGSDHDLIIKYNEDAGQDNTLNLILGDASKTLTFEDDAIVSQDYSTDAAVIFGSMTLAGVAVGVQRTVEAHTEGVGAPHVLAASDCYKVITNEGSTALNYHTLPAAAPNLTFTFVVQDNDGLRITAAGGDTIRNGAGVTGGGGNAAATVVGSSITLVAINATEWIAIASVGTWVLT